MSSIKGFDEVEKELAPCPFCNSQVKMLNIRAYEPGDLEVDFYCPFCGFEVTLRQLPDYYYPRFPDRRTLPPWEQWNLRGKLPGEVYP